MFATVQSAVAKQFKAMSSKRLFSSDSDPATLWDTYLTSFPDGSNPLYKKRTEHDCSCCRHFIKNIGGVVNIVDGKIVTLWDVKVDGPYQPVVAAMAKYVRERAIVNVYLHSERQVGTASSRQLLEDSTVKSWEHFHVNLPASAVLPKTHIGPKEAEFRAKFDVMKRGLTEITTNSLVTVLDLIAQNSLYRGEEHKFAVEEFFKLKTKFNKEVPEDGTLFVWEHMEEVPPSVSKIRNTVIGELLTSLSEGKELELAVEQFEKMVAPTNYKRPTALVTKAMVEKAQQTVDQLGLTTALDRRYATLDDLTINNLLFADRELKKAMNVFDEISAGAPIDPKKMARVEGIPVKDFLEKVLPTAETLEVLLENNHAGNMVSLVAPVDPTASQLFKWPNGFSWSYAGDLADSIKERVKKAGGSVTGDFRASLSWSNHDDLDLHLLEPNKFHIYFGSKHDPYTNGKLDVDMNAGHGTTRSPVENITFPSRELMLEGEYTLLVHQFYPRESSNVGFEVEVEFDGVIHNFGWSKPMKLGQSVDVCRFGYTRNGGLEVVSSLPSTQTSRTIWSLPTQAFHRVRAVMLSPNQWDGREIGNKHFFFMLDGCKNDLQARGFFNEFLSESLTPHRKVLELVGAKMRTEKSDSQLSGLGFSSTQKNHLFCRVTGSFSRVVKVLF